MSKSSDSQAMAEQNRPALTNVGSGAGGLFGGNCQPWPRPSRPPKPPPPLAPPLAAIQSPAFSVKPRDTRSISQPEPSLSVCTPPSRARCHPGCTSYVRVVPPVPCHAARPLAAVPLGRAFCGNPTVGCWSAGLGKTPVFLSMPKRRLDRISPLQDRTKGMRLPGSQHGGPLRSSLWIEVPANPVTL